MNYPNTLLNHKKAKKSIKNCAQKIIKTLQKLKYFQKSAILLCSFTTEHHNKKLHRNKEGAVMAFNLGTLTASSFAIAADGSGEVFAQVLESAIHGADADIFIGPKGVGNLRKLLRLARDGAGRNAFDMGIVLGLTKLADGLPGSDAAKARLRATAGAGPELINRFIDAADDKAAEHIMKSRSLSGDRLADTLIWSSSVRMVHKAEHHQPGPDHGRRVGTATNTEDGVRTLMREGFLCLTCFSPEERAKYNALPATPKPPAALAALANITDEGVRNFVTALYGEADAETRGNTGRGLAGTAGALCEAIAAAVSTEPGMVATLISPPADWDEEFKKKADVDLGVFCREPIGTFFLLSAMRLGAKAEDLKRASWLSLPGLPPWLTDAWDHLTGDWTPRARKELVTNTYKAVMGGLATGLAATVTIASAVFLLVLGILLWYAAVNWLGFVTLFLFVASGFGVIGFALYLRWAKGSELKEVFQHFGLGVWMLLGLPVVFTVLTVATFMLALSAGDFSWPSLLSVVVFAALTERMTMVPDAIINVARGALVTIVRAIPGQTAFEADTIADLKTATQPFRQFGLILAMATSLFFFMMSIIGIWRHTLPVEQQAAALLFVGLLAGWYPMTVLRRSDWTPIPVVGDASNRFALRNWRAAENLLVGLVAFFLVMVLVIGDYTTTETVTGSNGQPVTVTRYYPYSWRLANWQPVVIAANVRDNAYRATGYDPATGEACPADKINALQNAAPNFCVASTENVALCRQVVADHPGCETYLPKAR
jgi:hypothetical protein